MGYKPLSPEMGRALHDGLVIPAHPLALDERRRLDERHQRALTRYYIASGAGGIAVGVHSTQFEIRDPSIGLYEPVLRLAAEEVERAELSRPFLKAAGICGPTEQALGEAQTAAALGYEAGLLSMGGFEGDFGFYMGYRVNFERANIQFDGAEVTVNPNDGPSFVPELSADSGYYGELVYFLNAVLSDRPIAVCTPESTAATLAVIRAEAASASQEGAWVPVAEPTHHP